MDTMKKGSEESKDGVCDDDDDDDDDDDAADGRNDTLSCGCTAAAE